MINNAFEYCIYPFIKLSYLFLYTEKLTLTYVGRKICFHKLMFYLILLFRFNYFYCIWNPQQYKIFYEYIILWEWDWLPILLHKIVSHLSRPKEVFPLLDASHTPSQFPSSTYFWLFWGLKTTLFYIPFLVTHILFVFIVTQPLLDLNVLSS